MKRTATAVWQGTGKEGKGQLTTQSGALENAPYNFVSRFENGGDTNPEELIAAAHAGCFNMKLAFVLVGAGFEAENLETKCTITLGDGEVTNADLELVAAVPGISEEAFEAAISDAVENCPISKLLDADISIEAALEIEG